MTDAHDDPKAQNNDQGRLLTAKEAIQIFIEAGLSEPTFRRRVQKGKIDSIMPEGRERGALYPERQVRESAKRKGRADKEKESSDLKPAVLGQATLQDIEDMAPLLIAFYSSKISVQKRTAWIERNPEVAFILRSEGEAVGCAFVMPLTEEKILEILSSQVKPPTRPHEILLYQPGEHVHLYVRAVGVTQSPFISKEQRRYWAVKLITGLVDAIVALGERGIFVEKIYAQGDTRTGTKILRGLGFAQIDLNAPTTRKNFKLDVMQSGSPFAMRYKEALNRWRQQNEEE